MTMEKRIGVVGLGYVGLPAAIGFSKKYQVIGFDVDESKITQLKKCKDPTGQFSDAAIRTSSIQFVSDAKELHRCSHIIVTVPTPVTPNNQPDLTYLKKATCQIAKVMKKGTFIVYESTVYPGATEEICIPLLEQQSGWKAGKDFYVGYSPERINPGDHLHTFISSPKIVSGQNKQALEGIYEIYRHVIDAKIHRAPSMKVAEAAKVVENTQRDINIAFMNELSQLFNVLEIDTYEVLKAAGTKWNFLPFTPGLVGGHCIGVDPYYLIHQAESHGYSPTFLMAARTLNESMTNYIVHHMLHWVVTNRLSLGDLRVTVLGVTFKENIPDLRNSKSLEIVESLQQLGIDTQICDPYVNKGVLQGKVNVQPLEDAAAADIVILAVPHEHFKQQEFQYLKGMFKESQGLLMDLKGIIPNDKLPKDIEVWKL